MFEINKLWGEQEQYFAETEKILVGLNINRSQPGSGKTRGLINRINSKPDTKRIIFSENHDHLEEIMKNITVQYRHLEGFTRLCKRVPDKNKSERKWTDDEKLVMKILKGTHKPTKFLCSQCPHYGRNVKKCKYHSQFKCLPTIVLAPSEYLSSKYLIDWCQQIYIDEKIQKIDNANHFFSLETYNELLEKILEYLDDAEELEFLSKVLIHFNRLLLRHTSILFNQPPQVLKGFSIKIFSGSEWVSKGILQYKEYVSHWDSLSPVRLIMSLAETEMILLTNEKFRDKCKTLLYNAILECINNNDLDILYYCKDLDALFQTIDMFLQKIAYTKDFVVNEKIIKRRSIRPDELSNYILKIEDTVSYQRGFIDEKPYFWDKEKHELLLSYMGKEFSTEEVKLKERQDSRFTLGLPRIIKLFEIALTKPVYLMDASFDETVFNLLLQRFELSNNYLFSNEELHSNISSMSTVKNKQSIVYKILNEKGNDLNYSKSTLHSNENKKIEEIKKDIEKLIQISKENNQKIGLITYKNYLQYFDNSHIKRHTAYYFNQRGTNALEKCDILITLGTPYVPPYTTPYTYVLLFGKIPKSTEVKTINKAFDGYIDPHLHTFFRSIVEEEVYQSIHRIRGLLSNKIIICYTMVPERIMSEFDVRFVKIENVIADIKGRKKYYLEHPKSILKIISDCLQQQHNQKYEMYQDWISDQSVEQLFTQKISTSMRDTIELFDNALNLVEEKIVNLLKKCPYKKIGLTRLCDSATKQGQFQIHLAKYCIARLESKGKVSVEDMGGGKIVILKCY